MWRGFFEREERDAFLVRPERYAPQFAADIVLTALRRGIR